jgi:hypothetical protein
VRLILTWERSRNKPSMSGVVLAHVGNAFFAIVEGLDLLRRRQHQILIMLRVFHYGAVPATVRATSVGTLPSIERNIDVTQVQISRCIRHTVPG